MTDFDTRVRAALTAARSRTHALTDCLDEPELVAQHSRLMSPLVWDLAHVGNHEDIWIVRALGGRPALRADLDDRYDALEHARAARPDLPLLGPDQARDYIASVREQALEVLDAFEPDDEPGRRLLAYTAQHEQQHCETMLATHQLREGEPVLDAPAPEPVSADLPPEVAVAAGPFTMGTSEGAWALDNERPAHTVDVPAFRIDTVPVTNAAFARFIDDGGYENRRWWTPEGWRHRREAGLRAPLFWFREGDRWLRRRFGRTEPVPPAQPVVHVCWYEADAYARWAGRRLPTEAEWEKAARWDPETGETRHHPWGEAEADTERAGLAGRHLEPAPAGSFPAGAAPCGARQLIGDVWEWTASDFTAYPGFAACPGSDYSEVFFDRGYKVLRGGSFGTHPDAARATFRNWDLAVRRQIFAGFRTVESGA